MTYHRTGHEALIFRIFLESLIRKDIHNFRSLPSSILLLVVAPSIHSHHQYNIFILLILLLLLLLLYTLSFCLTVLGALGIATKMLPILARCIKSLLWAHPAISMYGEVFNQPSVF